MSTRQRSVRGALTARGVLIVVSAGVFIGLAIVRFSSALATANRDHDIAQVNALWLGAWITTSVVALGFGGLIVALIPGALRLRALEKKQPGWNIATLRWNSNAARLLGTAGVSDDQTRRVTLSVAAAGTPAGVTLWAGAAHPRELKGWPWSAVGSVTCEPRQIGGRKMYALCLRFTDSKSADLSLVVAGRSFIGFFPASQPEAERFVETLQRSLEYSTRAS